MDSELARHTVADLLNEHLAVYNNDISVNARKLGALPSTIAAIEYYPLIVNLQVNNKIRLVLFSKYACHKDVTCLQC